MYLPILLCKDAIAFLNYNYDIDCYATITGMIDKCLDFWPIKIDVAANT